jgi:Zn-dependent protease
MFGTVAPTPYDLRFSLFGIPVRVHPFFWLVSLVMGWNPHHPKLMLIWVVCVFVSILVHELGHALMAQYFGWPPHIVLYSFGGYASYQPTWGHSTARSILVLFAGPGARFVLFGLVVGVEFLLVYRGVELPYLAQVAVADMIWINLLWGLVNLLPVYPLDGGQICRAALNHWRPYDGADISLKLSLIFAIGVAVLAYRFGQTYSAFLFAILAFENFQTLQGGRLR